MISSPDDSRPQEVHRLVSVAKDSQAVESEPGVQYRCENPAEIGVKLEPSLVIRVGEAGMRTDKPTGKPSTDEKHRRRRSMTGSPPPVLLQSTAELGECH